nr:HGGxSTG domain-containing protein [Bradyrhizobium sp. WSM1743]
MLASPRCGAGTRSGFACFAPAVRGKSRCRMHGGAAGSGPPWGNRNARKHGAFTRERFDERKAIRALLDETRKLLVEMTSTPGASVDRAAPSSAAGEDEHDDKDRNSAGGTPPSTPMVRCRCSNRPCALGSVKFQ